MAFVARIAMVFSWLVLTGIVLIVSALALSGDVAPILDMVELPPDIPQPPNWALLGLIGLCCLALANLGIVYWRFHRVLRSAGQNQFDLLARELRTSGIALIFFYILFLMIFRFMPFALVWGVPSEEQPTIHWLPINLDIVFLIIGLVLLALASSFRRAAEVDDENRHFL
ncbi:hypothetical protein [Thalassococcus sp. S3]|uniref:hypothetical protein n=1 Tax=Thalassococcus sp. S3 TaxID=2017482 RepID=UPI0010240BB2|nr:hypothetical protein [Thalassococcus sp. S3]QBF32295.1 hypothetical protein CFI11_13840 [Thalassococcus sp. S3]